ncbi:MAG: RNA polymerase sigma factor [Bacteroidia bacterium]|nr:RNA polymerase sigma factor [Bacteroidia bacterium]NNF32128.1 RNA polymerase sigma factor [Flavobacteriaceae bacterium]MBT8274641.1 RNA polymerase sigma factor [Bacteroidia bacterium]NNJ82026.1 RNA polymerase sigma factor [Flavobacteriaceae bacterium]NNK55647.1 RNA polymerase sigma factor [Flavobacteriaceae bacterium]
MSLTSQNINTLLVLCKQGNQLAQLEVYNRYQQAMYNVSVRIVKNSAEAEDIMQESFITAFNKLDTFKGDASFGAWLKRIVINNSLTQYRKNSRFTVVSEDSISEEAHQDEFDLTEDDRSQINAKKLLDCMNELHESYNRILNLHFIEGYDYEEICEILNISYANCRTMISRAKESLRKKLTQVI